MVRFAPATGKSSIVPDANVWIAKETNIDSWPTEDRATGAIPVGLVKGHAVAFIWPPGRIGLVN
jgi:hypothetical protein